MSETGSRQCGNCCAAASALVALRGRSPAAAQAPFYQGKQLKVLVGFPPGGGTDLYGRVIADGLARHRRRQAGRGGAEHAGRRQRHRHEQLRQQGAARRHHRAHRHRPTAPAHPAGLDGARAKISDFHALVATPMGRITYASPSTGIKSAKDMLQPREPLILGVPEVISTIDAVLGLTLLKAQFRSVIGYPGKADMRLALLRNEINVDSPGDADLRAERAPDDARGQGAAAVRARASWRVTGSCAIRPRPMCRRLPRSIARFTASSRPGPAWEAYKAVGARGRQWRQDPDDPQRRAAGARATQSSAPSRR